MPLDDLPDDLLRACFAALDCPRSFSSASQVSRRWRTTSKSCPVFDAHILLCKLERRIVDDGAPPNPLVVDQSDLCTSMYGGKCCAAVTHPAGLLYTAHQGWRRPETDLVNAGQIELHVWDLHSHVPAHLHSFPPTERDCDGDCCMHIDGGFLGWAGPLAGRPQIRHALRPAQQPGMVIQSKLSNPMAIHVDDYDRMATAIQIRAAKRDAVVGYASGRVTHHDLESGACLGDLGGCAQRVVAIASHGDQVFVGGRGFECASLAMLTSSPTELFGNHMLRPWGTIGHISPTDEAFRLLKPSIAEGTRQVNALLLDSLLDGQMLLAGAGDTIFVCEGVEEPQLAPPTLAYQLELQHPRRGYDLPRDGVCQLAYASEREQLFVGINGLAHESIYPGGGVESDCQVQVWHLPRASLGVGGSPAVRCLHTLPAGHSGAITAMLLAGERLLTWGSDRKLRVWRVHPARAEASAAAASDEDGPAPWEVGGGAPHPSLEDGKGMFTGEEPWVWEGDSDTEGTEDSSGSDEDEDEFDEVESGEGEL